MWHYISPLYPKGVPRKPEAKPAPVSPPKTDRFAPARSPQRSGEVADTARYFLKHGVTNPDVIAALLEGWDLESVEAVIREMARCMLR
jgi:hypothetical protein